MVTSTMVERYDNTGIEVRRRLEWTDGVWVWEAPLRFYGIPFGTRMTVVRLAAGGLFVHSPIALDGEIEDEIDALGEVFYVVSPNKLHHLYMGDWQNRYPQAKLYSSPGLARRRKDLRFTAELGDDPAPAWAGDIDQCVLRGSRVMEEVDFCHRPSRTLIIADMIEYFGPHSSHWLTRLVTRVAGFYNRPVMPPDWRLTYRDRVALRASLEKILSWDFDRVILAHGKLIESDGKDIFRESFRWALA